MSLNPASFWKPACEEATAHNFAGPGFSIRSVEAVDSPLGILLEAGGRQENARQGFYQRVVRGAVANRTVHIPSMGFTTPMPEVLGRSHQL